MHPVGSSPRALRTSCCPRRFRMSLICVPSNAMRLASLLVTLFVALCLAPLSGQAQRTIDSPALATQEDLLDENGLELSGVPTAIAQFTTGIENREPVDQVSFVKNHVRKIFFFSDLRNLEGERVSHQWSYEGRVIATVDFDVRGPRWRVWSSKEMKPAWTGDWTVEILKSDGEVVAAETFSYTPAEN